MHQYQSFSVEPNRSYQFAQLSDLLLHYSPMVTTTAPLIKTNLKKEPPLKISEENQNCWVFFFSFFFLSI